MASTAELPVSAIVHARDAAETLEACLVSLRFAREILVVDMASRDATREIAARHAHRVLDAAPAPRVDGVRNRFLSEAREPWVLVLDADERLAADAPERLKALLERHGERYDAFALPRYNEIAGQVLQGAASHPDPQVRLFRRGTVEWSDTHHDPPRVKTGAARLLAPGLDEAPAIHHRNYESVRHFIRKQLDYALSDAYDSDPGSFDLDAYLGRAHAALARRHDAERDGDLARAQALVLAWDAIVRALLHWEASGRQGSLERFLALPAAPAPGLCERLRRRALRLLRRG
jgi:glycosyltransferase involved in cell wall biosynthesis